MPGGVVIEKELINAVRSQFAIEWYGMHGIRHWARVYENGMYLAEGTDANLRVIGLFALFHDSCRQNEGTDPEHGVRGANLAYRLLQKKQVLDRVALELLVEACRCHTNRIHHDDSTVAICCDADRLDLARVGSIPDPRLLNTAKAKERRTIDWAVERSNGDYLPDNVLADYLRLEIHGSSKTHFS